MLLKICNKKHENFAGLTNQQGMTNETPITKIAERVRLRRTTEEPHLTGTDLTSSGVSLNRSSNVVNELKKKFFYFFL